jgi:hypothetical protein
MIADIKRIVAIDIPAGGEGNRLKRHRIVDPVGSLLFCFGEPQLLDIEVRRRRYQAEKTAATIGSGRRLCGGRRRGRKRSLLAHRSGSARGTHPGALATGLRKAFEVVPRRDGDPRPGGRR